MHHYEPKSFPFHQMVTPQRPQPPTSASKSPHNIENFQSTSQPLPSQQLSAKINATTQFIKLRTIALVKNLRQYSLPSTLEGDIESYLTDVLDQMDLLQNINSTPTPQSISKSEPQTFLSFSQLDKPQGDEEEVALEDTLRELTPRLNVLPEESHGALHDKIENILKSIDAPYIEEDSNEYLESERQPQNVSTTQGSDSRFKGAHRFSSNYSNYLKNAPKSKKPKIL